MIPGFLIGRVVESNCSTVPEGSLVADHGEWADFLAIEGEKVDVVPESDLISNRLSILGLTGKAAYFGLLHIGKATADETLVVSAAAGSVGALVGFN